MSDDSIFVGGRLSFVTVQGALIKSVLQKAVCDATAPLFNSIDVVSCSLQHLKRLSENNDVLSYSRSEHPPRHHHT